MMVTLFAWVCQREIPGTFTFDSYFSSAENLNHIHGKQNARGDSRGYVGDLKTNRKLEVRGQSIKVDEFAASIEPSARKELRRGDNRQWYFTATVRLPQVKHPVRIVLLWRNRRDTRLAKVLITNRTHWDEIKSRVPGFRTVPQIFLDGQHIGGFDDLARHFRQSAEPKDRPADGKAGTGAGTGVAGRLGRMLRR